MTSKRIKNLSTEQLVGEWSEVAQTYLIYQRSKGHDYKVNNAMVKTLHDLWNEIESRDFEHEKWMKSLLRSQDERFLLLVTAYTVGRLREESKEVLRTIASSGSRQSEKAALRLSLMLRAESHESQA